MSRAVAGGTERVAAAPAPYGAADERGGAAAGAGSRGSGAARGQGPEGLVPGYTRYIYELVPDIHQLLGSYIVSVTCSTTTISTQCSLLSPCSRSHASALLSPCTARSLLVRNAWIVAAPRSPPA